MALALTNWCVDGLYLPDEVIDRITRAILDKSIIFAVTPSLGMWTLVDYWYNTQCGDLFRSLRHPYHADLAPWDGPPMDAATDTAAARAFRNDRMFVAGLKRLRGNAAGLSGSCRRVKIPIVAASGHGTPVPGSPAWDARVRKGIRIEEIPEYRTAHADTLMVLPQLLTAYQLKDYLAMNEIHFRKSWTKKKLIKACMSF